MSILIENLKEGLAKSRDRLLANQYWLFKWQLQQADKRFDPRTISLRKFRDARGKNVDTSQLLNDLLRDGIAVVDGLYSKAWVDRAYDRVMSQVAEFKKGNLKAGSLWQPGFGYDTGLLKTGIIRFYNAGLKIPQADEFANNPLLKYIGELYYQHPLHLQTVITQYNKVSKIPCRGYHIDSYVDEYKTFIYLNDVGINNGPHTYLKGSHQNTEPIVRKLHQCYRDQVLGNPENKDSTGVTDKQAKRLGFEKFVATGKRGTILLVDTRGVHQGGTLVKGHRAVFNTYFY